jgi:hypothetical protein
MISSLRAKGITVSELQGRTDLRTFFEDNAMVDILAFLTNTEVVIRPAAETNKWDAWDIEGLDRSRDEEIGVMEMKDREMRGVAQSDGKTRRAQSPKAVAACWNRDSEQDCMQKMGSKSRIKT